ncbi:MAG: asparaginase [Cyclobacteriaceae bacterium]|nr:asparaginase [Cyclobacteriaceae bacterium]
MEYRELRIDTASPNPPLASILLLYTGGTMGMVKDDKGILVPFNFEHILEYIPSLKTFELEIKVIAFEKPIDSSNVSPDHWSIMGHIIKDHAEFDGFVILHGTDTMAYTASALSYMLVGLNKPVILTGAQLPITVPRTDARENLITAIEIASAKENGKPIVSEVCIYFDSVLLRGNRTRKVESMHFDAFESENYPPLAEAGIVIDYNKKVMLQMNKEKSLTFNHLFDERVVILKIFPGINKHIVHRILSCKEVKGIVLETYGSGNAPTASWFIEEIKQAIDNEVLILNVSQCLGGEVMQGRYETSKQLEEVGVLSGGEITTEAAITKLMFLLSNCKTYSELKQKIVLPLCGEIN